MKKKNLVILGSTGSIGVSALDVVRRNNDQFRVLGLSANRNISLLLEQIKEFSPKVVALGDGASATDLKGLLGHSKNRPLLWNHSGGAEQLARIKESDVVLCAMVGFRGLLPLVAALKSGKTVCLANKEALIVAGEIIMDLSRRYKAPVIPVDSEHSAIFQCLLGHDPSEISRLILTASGGPFYKSRKNLEDISVKEALQHPTWKMGAKITIDSATLMNKGLEAIEAHHLFQVPMDRISIVIHPQSIVHSLVEFKDGSLLAQLSHPDMRLPIQYALTHPARQESVIKRLDLETVRELNFAKPDFSRFPCLRMALEAGKKGGTAPVVLSSSNEEAVQAFLENKISFMDIPRVVGHVLNKHPVRNQPSLKDVLEVDAWSREEAKKRIHSLRKK